MTDNEIIKALECCSTTMKLDCKECPYMISYVDCRANQMKKDALDLITRQNAEIERLYFEIDKLIISKDQLFDEAEALIKKAKVEAIKGFADLSIKRICEQVSAPTPSESYIVERCNQVIDNTKKEMVGDV